MSLNTMKHEMHQRLWGALQRWFALREQGVTKRDLKLAGLRERNDPWSACRNLVFTGNTRLTYERSLKGFLDFTHARGIERNDDITKREMRDYVHHLIDRGASQSTLDKVRSACVKLGALYGKYESARSMSRKLGAEIRELVEAGVIKGPEHQRIGADVAQRAVARLHELDAVHQAETGQPRGYGLAAELQRACGLRAIEATQRLTRDRLTGGHVAVLGKGGRVRSLAVPLDLSRRIESFFAGTGSTCLAALRPYESAWRRAVLDIGGRSTGTHALRRLWAQDYRGERYRVHLARGMAPEEAAKCALADTLEALGHGRERAELKSAYLRAA